MLSKRTIWSSIKTYFQRAWEVMERLQISSTLSSCIKTRDKLNRPGGVSENQLATLCGYWESKEGNVSIKQ